MSVQVVTDYDIFKKIKDGLLAQGCQSVMKNGDCSYRGLSESTYEAIEAEVTAELNDELAFWHPVDLDDYQMTDSYFDDINNRINSYIEHMSDDDNRLKKCAAGQILSGQYYSASLEGQSIDDQLVWDAIRKSNPSWDSNTDSRAMLYLAQRIHDMCPVEDWDRSFNKMQQYFTAENVFDISKIMLDSRVPELGEVDDSYKYLAGHGFLSYLFDFICRED